MLYTLQDLSVRFFAEKGFPTKYSVTGKFLIKRHAYWRDSEVHIIKFWLSYHLSQWFPNVSAR